MDKTPLIFYLRTGDKDKAPLCTTESKTDHIPWGKRRSYSYCIAPPLLQGTTLLCGLPQAYSSYNRAKGGHPTKPASWVTSWEFPLQSHLTGTVRESVGIDHGESDIDREGERGLQKLALISWQTKLLPAALK